MDVLCVLAPEKPPAVLSAPPPHPRPFLEVSHSSAVHQHGKQDTTPGLRRGRPCRTDAHRRVTARLRAPPARSHLRRGGRERGALRCQPLARSSKHGQEMLWWGFGFSPLCSVRAQRTTWPSPAPARLRSCAPLRALRKCLSDLREPSGAREGWSGSSGGKE